MTGRLEAIGVVAIVAVSVVVRVYPAWNATFGGDHVDFLETDAWYHLRLVENQVRNWPLRLTLDPYAAPGGQYVPIAPLFDTITATVVRVLGGPDASTALAERVAALMPPVFGALTIVALWALARRAFDERAALIGAALLAVLPGHFLDRTMLGFYDHHALESCLAMTVLWTLAMALRAPELAKEGRRSSLVGVALALYLLTWSSGAFLLGVLGVWLVVLIPLARPLDLSESARVTGIAAL
ncbi:MAG TPA: STT3 domain-containing protein, partial [Vicinamibacterales bacterium]|nr:STT3 domain-containing protein [Vicinamibacterales bacterium]